MNRSVRLQVWELVEKAKATKGQPSAADIERARELFETTKDILSDQISSNVRIKMKYREDSGWHTWSDIEEFFTAYHAALVDRDNALAKPLAQERLWGI